MTMAHNVSVMETANTVLFVSSFSRSFFIPSYNFQIFSKLDMDSSVNLSFLKSVS